MIINHRISDFEENLSFLFQRVMQGGFFLLLRFFMRVDGVLIRINDTRIYHKVKISKVKLCHHSDGYMYIIGFDLHKPKSYNYMGQYPK